MDKRTTLAEAVSELRDGMTLGLGGWGSRRKPMAFVREILRTSLRDLTVVAYGGPDVGLLCAAGRVRRLIYGFVSLDSIPLEPHFRAARQAGAIEARELDEGMLQWGLYAAGLRLPFLPTRAGLGSDVDCRICWCPLGTTIDHHDNGLRLLQISTQRLGVGFQLCGTTPRRVGGDHRQESLRSWLLTPLQASLSFARSRDFRSWPNGDPCAAAHDVRFSPLPRSQVSDL